MGIRRERRPAHWPAIRRAGPPAALAVVRPFARPAVWLAILLTTLLAVAPRPAGAEVILNTLRGYGDRQPGWSGNVDGLFSASGGNTERLLIALGGKVQWHGERTRWRLQGSLGYEEVGGVEASRDIVSHLRHNYDLSPTWATVAFTQVQHNPFQRLRSRWLLGAGLRCDVYDDDRGQVAIGATPMLERERIQDEGEGILRGRLSTFVHVSRRLSEATRLDATGFWQPLFSDLGNLRAVGNLVVTVDLTGALDLKIGVAVEHNARPAAGVEPTDWSTYVGLGYGF